MPVLAQAAQQTGDLRAVVGILASDPKGPPGGRARVPRAGLRGARCGGFTGLQAMSRAQSRTVSAASARRGRTAAGEASPAPGAVSGYWIGFVHVPLADNTGSRCGWSHRRCNSRVILAA